MKNVRNTGNSNVVLIVLLDYSLIIWFCANNSIFYLSMNAICVANIPYIYIYIWYDIYIYTWGIIGPTNMFTFHPSQHTGQAKAMNMKIGNYLSNPEAPEWTEGWGWGQVAKNQSGPGCWCLGFSHFGRVAVDFVLKVVIM